MKKEEILKQAQNEKNNEYEENEYNLILSKSVLLITGLCTFFWLTKIIHADMVGLETVSSFEFPAILMGYAMFVYLGLFVKLKNKWHLMCGIFFAIGFVIFLAKYFISL